MLVFGNKAAHKAIEGRVPKALNWAQEGPRESDDRISCLPSPGFSYTIQSLYIWIPSPRRRFRFRWKKRCAAVTLITP